LAIQGKYDIRPLTRSFQEKLEMAEKHSVCFVESFRSVVRAQGCLHGALDHQ